MGVSGLVREDKLLVALDDHLSLNRGQLGQWGVPNRVNLGFGVTGTGVRSELSLLTVFSIASIDLAKSVSKPVPVASLDSAHSSVSLASILSVASSVMVFVRSPEGTTFRKSKSKPHFLLTKKIDLPEKVNWAKEMLENVDVIQPIARAFNSAMASARSASSETFPSSNLGTPSSLAVSTAETTKCVSRRPGFCSRRCSASRPAPPGGL